MFCSEAQKFLRTQLSASNRQLPGKSEGSEEQECKGRWKGDMLAAALVGGKASLL